MKKIISFLITISYVFALICGTIRLVSAQPLSMNQDGPNPHSSTIVKNGIPANELSDGLAQTDVPQLQGSFVPNHGQIKDEEVKFQANNLYGVTLIKPGELHLIFDDQPSIEHKQEKYNNKTENDQSHNQKPPYELKVKYLQFNKDAQVLGTNPLGSKMNFFIGSDSADWQTDVVSLASDCGLCGGVQH